MRRKRMTDKLEAVFQYIQTFYRKNDQLPPGVVITAHFGWKSNRGQEQYMERLVKHGLIERNEIGRWKFTKRGREGLGRAL